MRWLGLFLVAACAFHRGAGALQDGPPAGSDAPAIDARMIDAPRDGSNIIIDAPPDAFSCSSAGLSCPGGGIGVAMCNGDCWVSCPATGDEPTAAAACQAWGGRLAPLQTQQDQDCVHLTVLPGKASWIGFEQANNASAVNTDWSWNSDGIAPTFLNWNGGQPNDGDGVEDGTEQCAYMSNPSGTWQDQPCSTSFANFSCRHGL